MDYLLSTAYFAPVQWYSKLYRAGTARIERHESYIKQTYRNRCVIATANGPQTLTVPVERGSSQLMRDTRISDHGNWRHQHVNALASAYSESPFFEYFIDDLMPFYDRKWEFLLDFNIATMETVCELLDIEPHYTLTETFEATPDPAVADLRNAINPKHPAPDDTFTPRPYYQVFARKHGFLPNMSILDLLFNMGREGVMYL